MKFKKFLFSCLAVSSFVYGEMQSSWIDYHLSPFVGGENILMLHKGIERMEDSLFSKPSLEESRSIFLTSPSQYSRNFRELLFWIPVNLSGVVSQHEVFGHGYRIRDLGSEYATVSGYKMYVIGGSTSYQFTPQLTTSQLLSIQIAGIEANEIMANQMRMKWLGNGQIDPRQHLLYIASALSLTQYSFVKDPSHQNPATTGNDVVSFLHYLKATYPDTSLDQSQLRLIALTNLLDPFFYLSFMASYDYIHTGRSPSLPMFRFGPVKYLPAAKVALTPFGIQGFLEQFFQVNEGSPTYAYLKWGKNGANTYSGFGMRNEGLFQHVWGSLGLRADLWIQPDVLFEQGLLSAGEVMEIPRGAEIPQLYPDEVLQKKRWGGAVSLIGAIGKETWPARMLLELGCKSQGFLPGEALRAAPIVRGGFSAHF